MRNARALILCLCLLPAATAGQSAQAQQTRLPQSQHDITLSFAPVVRASAPAVVNIYARRVVERRASPFADDPFFGELFRNFGATPTPRVQNSLGSGVILAADGIVVSNYHVVGSATDIRVVLQDGREFDARVLLGDKAADLAILQLEGAADLPYLPLRDSNALEVGELVLAIGNPFGIGQTVSSGIVSGLARSGLAVGRGNGYFIQTDAAINPGNSGGALVDTAARLVGVNTAILTRSGGSNGIGFAIPANLVRQFVAQARAGRTQFARAWAGISAQPVDAALSEGFGLGRPRGVVISDLHPLSPFGVAGLRVGDIVLTLGGNPVNTPQEMLFRMAAAGVGEQVALRYLRNGQEQRTSLTLIEAPDDPPRAPVRTGRASVLPGLAAITVNPAVAEEHGLAQSGGVLVTQPGDWGRRAGLRAGDVIQRINGRDIASSASLRDALREQHATWQIEYLRKGRRSVLRFRI